MIIVIDRNAFCRTKTQSRRNFEFFAIVAITTVNQQWESQFLLKRENWKNVEMLLKVPICVKNCYSAESALKATFLHFALLLTL